MNYSGYFGVDQIPGDVYDVMNADQYSNYLGQACKNSNTPLPGGYKMGEDGMYHFRTKPTQIGLTRYSRPVSDRTTT